MAMSIDTLISNIGSYAIDEGNNAYDYAWEAEQKANGTVMTTDARFVSYIAPPDISQLNIPLPPDLNNVPGRAIVDGISADLTRYFNRFFPGLSANYFQWLTLLKQAVENGVPITLDNSLLSAQRQAMGEQEGMRQKRTIRNAWAGRGYDKAPGALVGMTLDDIDSRTEKLIDGAVGAANQSVQVVLNGYKSVINTALATADARAAAVRAMTALMNTAIGVYTAKVDAATALLRARAAAAEAALAYYRAIMRLDELNTGLYQTNVGLATQRYQTDGSLFMRNEDAQVSAAIAKAEQAAKIAQAAFSALNTVSSASTVGFA